MNPQASMCRILMVLLSEAIITTATSFDYVIAGGGTCGLLLANRLSEDPNVSVAVIEPGEDTRNNPNVTDAGNFITALGTSIDWAYPSTAQPGAANRSFSFHSGKAIGGTSTINGMTYVRADAAEIDAWEALGNKGWNWDTLFQYYKRTERFTPPTTAQEDAGASFEPQSHGYQGELHVGYRYAIPNGSFPGIVQTTWESLGYPLNPDVNSGDTRGFDVWPMTIDRNPDLRWDSARAYYYPVEGRANLVLFQGTALNIEWEEDGIDGVMSATGVRYVDRNNQTVTLDVSKEAIISTGALRTPLLLEMSGIGNPSVLQELGIEAIIDLPGVGENLQEQPNSNLIYVPTHNVTGYTTYATFANAEDLFGAETAAVSSDVGSKLTAYAENAASQGGLNASAIEKILRIQHDLIFNKKVTIGETITASSSGFLLTAWWCLLPFSRGRVHLASIDAYDSPMIDPQYFAADIDMTTQVAIGKQAQSFWHAKPVAGITANNVTADPWSDEEWVGFITNNFEPNYHPIGTASMMARELGGVVDSELKVYGTSNVRVVDASVLPLQLSGHLTATLYALAERASQFIRTAA
ncbi:hypothetical protein KVR01_004818 [Diaporthe batatas]|uniref:uncharacterized protein n=1 Tax=Diaporthe batatas TaxID=748121 RepID=UPI001D03DB87|nr:uncharacterized protein KVR01_004818 [Diaporthe batatas]KAG8166266.1 hypothetical protein KVR01_004818 [Diaporthe batatas]